MTTLDDIKEESYSICLFVTGLFYLLIFYGDGKYSVYCLTQYGVRQGEWAADAQKTWTSQWLSGKSIKKKIFFFTCFTILCWFLPYNMNQIYIYTHTYMHIYVYTYICMYVYVPPSWASISSPHSTTLVYYRASDRAPTVLHRIVCIWQYCFLNSAHPHLQLLCPQVCSLLGLSVPFF